MGQVSDRSTEKVSSFKVTQLSGMPSAVFSLSHHSPCLLQRHLIMRRIRASKFSTCLEPITGLPGLLLLPRRTNYAPAGALGPGLGPQNTAEMMSRMGRALNELSCTRQAGLWRGRAAVRSWMALGVNPLRHLLRTMAFF